MLLWCLAIATITTFGMTNFCQGAGAPPARKAASTPQPTPSVPADFDALLATVKSPVVLKVDETEVTFHYGPTTRYIIGGGTPSGQFVVEVNGRLAIDNKYFKAGSQTYTVKLSSSNPKIIDFPKDHYGGYGVFNIRTPGKVVLTVAAGANTIRIPISVIKVPVRSEMTTDQIIKVLGLPDKETNRYIPWPETENVDDLYYTTSDGHGRFVRHWLYNRYPGAVFRISTQRTLSDCVMPEVEKVARYRYGLESQN
jgi:hypothetical protein